ncbi:MAG TPA: c-type cytochrome [Caulobacteraceae bacterium]
MLKRGRRALPIAAAILTLSAVAAAAMGPRPPAWAFPQPPASTLQLPAGEAAVRLRGLARPIKKAFVDQLFAAADWSPGDHPPMPAIVAHGRRPDVYACGLCHLADGQGKPENASLAGLPAAYIVQQLAEMRAGRRGSAVAGLTPQALMRHVAESARPGEVAAAALYFAGLPYRPWIRVVETGSVPRLKISAISTFEPAAGGGVEPLGERIVEMPDWPARSPGGHPRGFVAYAPVGSVRRGAALAASGEGRTMACAACHGVRLQGLDEAPRLAGRSPTYLARQLFDLRAGARRGPAVARMAPAAAQLTNADIVDLAAYLGSLRP